jgi:hypothetical protein
MKNPVTTDLPVLPRLISSTNISRQHIMQDSVGCELELFSLPLPKVIPVPDYCILGSTMGELGRIISH